MGLCNVTLGQVQEACVASPIDAVQLALPPRKPAALRTGLLPLSEEHDIVVIAHSLLGGARGAGRMLRRLAAATERFAIPPQAFFDYQRQLEEPVQEEGFASIGARDFTPSPASTPADESAGHAGIVISFDAAFEAEDLPRDGVRHLLQAAHQEGMRIDFIAWRPPRRGEPVDLAPLQDGFMSLECAVDLWVCVHAAGPQVCWCP